MPNSFDDNDRFQMNNSENWDESENDDVTWRPTNFDDVDEVENETREASYASDFNDELESPIEPAEWDEEPLGEEFEEPRRPSLLMWVAGGGVAVLVLLALFWGISGIGRVEPTPTPTPTQIAVFVPTITATVAVTTPVEIVATPTEVITNINPLVIVTPTVVTETPATPVAVGAIRAGVKVKVINSEPEGISLRSGAGLQYVRLTTLHDGATMTIIDPPQNFNEPYPSPVNGYTWWRVRLDSDGTVGWVAANWLEAVN